MSISQRESFPQSENDDKNCSYMVKFIIVGDPFVGKSNIMFRFIKGEFNSIYQNTVGLSFGDKHLIYNNTDYLIQIFDTAGQEQFKSIIRGYYQGAAVAMVVYDITKEESFEKVKGWIKDCQEFAPSTAILCLIGNKCDLEKERKIEKERGEKLANEYGMDLFFETSALSGKGINEAFQNCIETLDHRIKDGFYEMDKSYMIGIKKFSKEDNNRSIDSEALSKGQKKRKKKECCS